MAAQNSSSKDKKKTASKTPAKKSPGKKAEVKAAREQLLKELFEPKTETVTVETIMIEEKQDIKPESPQEPAEDDVNTSVTEPAVVSEAPEEPVVEPQPEAEPTHAVAQEEKPQPSEEVAVHDESPAVEEATPEPEVAHTTNPHEEAFSGDPNQEDDYKKKWILNFLIILFGTVLLIMLYFYLQSLRLGQPPQKANSITPTVTEEKPTATPKVAFNTKDLAKYPIEVLNGSGVRGEAAKVQEQLEAEDFVISDIGNADASTYEETVIQYGSDVPKAFVDLLKKELEKTYVVKTEKLDEESDTVTVIVGSLTSDSAEDEEDSEVTPTKAAKATPTPEEE